MELESCVYMKNMMLFLQKAVHRVGEALPLPEGAGRASDIHGSEGQQRPEHVAVIQVETLGRKLYYIINYYQHDFLFNHFILILFPGPNKVNFLLRRSRMWSTR